MNETQRLQELWPEARSIHLRSVAQREYYSDSTQEEIKKAYYEQISFESSQVMEQLHALLAETHHTQLPYAPFKYLYPWVDLHENRQLKSIYSGTVLDPLTVIEEDIRIIGEKADGRISELSTEIKLNCEHIVPQSWFGKKEPMKGDLHHLFACEPACNSKRGNLPYTDFPSYTPEAGIRGITTGCGMSESGKFEPEYGKGIAARATLYFYLRYSGIVDISSRVDLKLLFSWHKEFPVTLYELHRNAAIHELQGNRNPFIDHGELLAGNPLFQ
ncbi:endonuclease I family protein [Peribacillus kribbensis]|uniref:endonuclease I family protein n=1 Tax=Peribacillus kribbensis TaxID=356658 RepID=UPI000424DB79|nr:endonuclease [Peribacillus kribbensis]